MAWKNIKQRSLAEAMLVEHDAIKELDDVHELIDWTKIEKLLSGIHAKPKGEKAWPPLLMFKALLLQSWYALSDPRLEKQEPAPQSALGIGARFTLSSFCGFRYFGIGVRS